MTAMDFDAIVVGAGLLGCSTALHLLQAGFAKVLVVDAVAPGAATSGAGAGFVGTWAAGYVCGLGRNELLLENYGIEFYRSLAMHADIGLRSNGNMYLACTSDGDPSVRAILDHPLAPPGTRELSPAQVAQLSGGLIDPDTIHSAALHPDGIQLDTTPTVAALAQWVSELGGQFAIGAPVIGLLQTDARIAGVLLPDGPIRAGRTVLATGAWTNTLLQCVGQQVPIANEVATRVISPAPSTGPVPPTMPTVMVPELNSLWLREHQGGLTWGNVAGYAFTHTLPAAAEPAAAGPAAAGPAAAGPAAAEPSAAETSAPGPSAGIGNRPRHEHLLRAMLADLHPALRKMFPRTGLTVAEWRQGTVGHTPDGLFLVGEVPDIKNLYVVAGCNEGGVTHGPGLGRLAVELITDQAGALVDPSTYRLDRFGPGVADETAVAAAYAAVHS